MSAEPIKGELAAIRERQREAPAVNRNYGLGGLTRLLNEARGERDRLLAACEVLAEALDLYAGEGTNHDEWLDWLRRNGGTVATRSLDRAARLLKAEP